MYEVRNVLISWVGHLLGSSDNSVYDAQISCLFFVGGRVCISIVGVWVCKNEIHGEYLLHIDGMFKFLLHPSFGLVV